MPPGPNPITLPVTQRLRFENLSGQHRQAVRNTSLFIEKCSAFSSKIFSNFDTAHAEHFWYSPDTPQAAIIMHSALLEPRLWSRNSNFGLWLHHRKFFGFSATALI